MVGGNLTAALQVSTTTKNEIGEKVQEWHDVVELTGFNKAEKEQIVVIVDGQEIEADVAYDSKKQAITVQILEADVTKEIRVKADGTHRQSRNQVEERCFAFLNQAEIRFEVKDRVYGLVQKESRIPVLMAQLQTMNLDAELLSALTELITAKLG